MEREKLTASQENIFCHIVNFIIDNQKIPTYRDLAIVSNLSFKALFDCVAILKRKKWIKEQNKIMPFDIEMVYKHYEEN